MITKPLDDLYYHFDTLEKACLDSNEPIFLKDKKRDRLVLMNGECYDQLIKGFDMTPFGIRPDIYEVMGCLEKILIYAEMTDEPIFVSIREDKDMVFMTPALYDVLADKTSEHKGEKLKIKIRKKRVFSREILQPKGAKVYPFEKYSRK